MLLARLNAPTINASYLVGRHFNLFSVCASVFHDHTFEEGYSRFIMESFVELLTRAAKQTTKDCTVDTCPVSASVYGYYPNKPVTLILIVLFGISMILHIYQAIKSRSWTFLVALGVGCFGESVGEYPFVIEDRNEEC